MKTLIALISIFFSYICNAQLSGTYTVGGNGDNYSTITSALQSLQAQGVNGPTTFLVEPKVYNEYLTVVNLSGVSEINTITFKSKNNNRIVLTTPVNNPNSATLTLFYCSYVIFKDFEITPNSNFDYLKTDHATKCLIENFYFSGSTNRNIIVSNSSELKFKNCKSSDPSSALNPMFELIGSTNNIIESCEVAYYLTFSGSSNNNITNNVFNVLATDAAYDTIIGNTANIISFNNNADNAFISNNKAGRISGLAANNVTLHHNFIDKSGNNSADGIFFDAMGEGHNLVISGNTIINATVGINPGDAVDPLIINNMIGGSWSSSDDLIYYGINCSGTKNPKVYNNTINLNPLSSSTKSAGIRLSYVQNAILKNNLVTTDKPLNQCLLIENNSTFTSDYNSFSNSNTGLIVSKDGSVYFNMTGWRSVSTQDMNSIAVVPSFMDITDLHISDTSCIDNGILLQEVAIDFDGEARPMNGGNDIGADEADRLTVFVKEEPVFSLNVFPNPADGIFNFTISNPMNARVEIFNTLGQLVYEGDFNSSHQQIDLSKELHGLYFAKVSDGQTIACFNLIKL